MYDNKVVDYFELNKTSGDFGVEIEAEFTNHLNGNMIEGLSELGWRIEGDDSLRGPSAELVMRSPKNKSSTLSLLHKTRKMFEESPIDIKKSVRAGVHIHMNMQNNTLKDVFRLLLVYYPFETVLLNKCGFGRQGNLFCLRHRDASFIITAMANAIQTDSIYNIRSNDFRYASMNFQSLFTYGSLEFRALATDPSLEDIDMWVEVLERLKKHALTVKDSWDNLGRISGEGARNYFTSVIGEDLAPNFYYEGMERDILRDLRNVQHLCNIASSKGM